MSLLELLRHHASRSRWETFAKVPDLSALLERLHQRGRQEYPQLLLPLEPFVIFLAHHLAVEIAAAEGASALRGEDLYLACAYGLGDAVAGEILESEHISKVRQSLRYADTPESAISEILQELRALLIEMRDPACTRRYYTGRGELLVFLRITALRKAGSYYRHRRANDKVR